MKKINNIATIFSFTGLICTSVIFAQDARFAQSYSNPLRINPALMGANHDIKFGMNYRSQWGTIDKGYKTYSFTGMYPIILKDNKGKFDVGVNVMNDKAGAFKTSDMALAIDYCKELSANNSLCLSLMGGYVTKSMDITNETFDSQYIQGAYNAANPANEATLNTKVSHPDLGFGFLWFYNPIKTVSRVNAYMGLAGYHLNQPNQSMLGGEGILPMRFTYQAGIKIYGNSKVDVSPGIRINNQNGNLEPAVGLYLDYNFNDNLKFVAGAWYRTHDANAIVVGFEHSNFTLGYSYDMIKLGLNDIKNTVSAHEITLSIKLRKGLIKKESDQEEKERTTEKETHSSPFSAF